MGWGGGGGEFSFSEGGERDKAGEENEASELSLCCVRVAASPDWE